MLWSPVTYNGGVADADEDADGEGLGDEDGEGLGEADAPISRAPATWPVPAAECDGAPGA
jgi:hypothetical protein